jgi:hypothetical protein
MIAVTGAQVKTPNRPITCATLSAWSGVPIADNIGKIGKWSGNQALEAAGRIYAHTATVPAVFYAPRDLNLRPGLRNILPDGRLRALKAGKSAAPGGRSRKADMAR